MWQYDINTKGSIGEFQKIANSVFFSNIPSEAKEHNDIKDSMKNDCFGVALDLMIRCKNWGFNLSTIKAKVFMQHSEGDNLVPYKTALFTSTLLPNCELRKIKSDVHFSIEVLDEFIQKVIEPNS
jgi:homoserine acetyltransferase